MNEDLTHLSAVYPESDFDTHFKVFHELMSNKVLEILLVASPYDAYILEEDGSLAAKIIYEYRGLNLSRPPRITHVANANEAMKSLDGNAFDLVIAMPHLDDMNAFDLGIAIKAKRPDLPVVLLAHSEKGVYPAPEGKDRSGIDRIFIWSGDSDLLLSIVKSVEDTMNVLPDTQKAMVRVLLLVDDSPFYISNFLPLIYREVVRQTQAVIEESLNHEHRILKMRARPKILIAESYEEAMSLYDCYKDYIFGVISDTRYPKDGKMTADAGSTLLTRIRKEVPDLPLLLLSSEPENVKRAEKIPAEFLDKNAPDLFAGIHDFFLNFLGFGDFVFRTPDGEEIARASNLKALEEILPDIPDEPLLYHATRNKFSNWIMARSETRLASILRKAKASDFSSNNEIRQYIIRHIHSLRRWRQQGVTVNFNPDRFDPDISDFLKIGEGSLGGKARGVAFVSNLLRQAPEIRKKYPDIDILVPKSLVLTTDIFDLFVQSNSLEDLADEKIPNERIADRFLKSKMPAWVSDDLKAYLDKVKGPLSVRSSGLLEDAHHHPFSGLYKTFMIPNNHSEMPLRLSHLETAIKLVYASTWFEGPKNFTGNTAYQIRKERMAILIQQLAGDAYEDYFYPAISGVAQSHNFYPVSPLTAEDGAVRIAMGFGKGATEEGALRFCSKYPQVLPQFSKIDDILKNAQRKFYALKIRDYPVNLYFHRGINLEKRDVDDAQNDFPAQALSSTYVPADRRIRDTIHVEGARLLTFAPVLKYDTFPLPELLSDLTNLSRKGMGCPVEFEFSVNLKQNPGEKHAFYILQMRPMSTGKDRLDVEIRESDIKSALCYSTQSLGNGKNRNIKDIVYVKPECFDPAKTIAMAEEIGIFNSGFKRSDTPYLLIGPGRWGSFDRWLGIPVKWKDISSVGTIIELRNDKLKADPSLGSHFFQHITAMDIPYITITEGSADFIVWDRLQVLTPEKEGEFVRHVRLDETLTIICDGKKSQSVILDSHS